MLSFYYDEENLSYCIKKTKMSKKKNIGEKKHSFLHETIVEKLITMDLLMKKCYKKCLHFMCTYG